MSGLIMLVLIFVIIYVYIVAIREILNENIDPVVKIILIAIILCTNILGLIVYYLFLRGNLIRWFSK